jgi:pimeloyl-ACP methyl ester carboxylesterase
MLVEKSYDTGEVVLNYAEGPDNGPPLLLIHGGFRWWKDFRPIMPELSKNYHLFAPDLRGHGKSGRAKRYYTLKDYSRDVTFLLEDLIQQPTILFGHSLGGWISLMIACNRPETVKALIIGDSPLNLRDFRTILRGYSERWTTERELTMKTYEELLTDFDAESARRLSQVDPEAFRYWIEGCEDASAFDKLFEGYDISEMLPGIDCPVLLLQGNTKALPDTDVELAKSILPYIKHVFFKDHGHYLGLDTGDITDLLEAVNSILESIE